MGVWGCPELFVFFGFGWFVCWFVCFLWQPAIQKSVVLLLQPRKHVWIKYITNPLENKGKKDWTLWHNVQSRLAGAAAVHAVWWEAGRRRWVMSGWKWQETVKVWCTGNARDYDVKRAMTAVSESKALSTRTAEVGGCRALAPGNPLIDALR